MIVFLLGLVATRSFGVETPEDINARMSLNAPALPVARPSCPRVASLCPGAWSSNPSESKTEFPISVEVSPSAGKMAAPRGGQQEPPPIPEDPGVRNPPPEIKFEAWKLVRQTDQAEEYELSFPTAMETAYPENNRVPVRAFLPADRLGPVPVVILLHYWGATSSSVEQSMAEQLNRRGIAAVIIALPYHMARTPKGTRSGELAIQPDPAKLVVTMAQCVWDVRRTIDWIQSNRDFNANKIGISGTSLGSIVASLTFGIDQRIVAGCFMLGGGDLAHILWNSSRVVSEREALRKRGYTEERMREALTCIEPLQVLKPSERKVFIVGAKHDTVIPPADVTKLIDALTAPEPQGGTHGTEASDIGEPRKLASHATRANEGTSEPSVLWLDSGHYGGIFVERQLARQMASFFDASFDGRGFNSPKSLIAPTVRIGLEVNPSSGLQVAVGFDVWRWSRNADGFASILLTPKGVQGFLGYNISNGLAFGISILPKRTTVGAFWSVVL
ncbi:MAG: alpha/beta hydrolase family protein [Fimbriimonadaceae bacterium]|nr:alpha/beta hydrolase family protein [Fimbriimonadaceae bacterium]